MPVDSEERTWMKPSAAQLHLTNGTLTSRAATQTCGVTGEVTSLSSRSSNA